MCDEGAILVLVCSTKGEGDTEMGVVSDDEEGSDD